MASHFFILLQYANLRARYIRRLGSSGQFYSKILHEQSLRCRLLLSHKVSLKIFLFINLEDDLQTFNCFHCKHQSQRIISYNSVKLRLEAFICCKDFFANRVKLRFSSKRLSLCISDWFRLILEVWLHVVISKHVHKHLFVVVFTLRITSNRFHCLVRLIILQFNLGKTILDDYVRQESFSNMIRFNECFDKSFFVLKTFIQFFSYLCIVGLILLRKCNWLHLSEL